MYHISHYPKLTETFFEIRPEEAGLTSYLEHLNRLLADLHPSGLENLDAAKVLEIKSKWYQHCTIF